MWLMLQQDEPDDYVIATGRDALGRGARRVRVRARRARLARTTSTSTSRSGAGKAELHDLVGDPAKAREQLGWEPTVDFEELVALLVDADLERVRAEARGTRDREPLPPG